jgi:hypothetical protein
LVKTEAEAMEVPLTAAKIAFAKTVAMASPPRNFRKSCPATSKTSRPSPDAPTNTPIRTKSGMTPKEYLATLSSAAFCRSAPAMSIRSRTK